MTSATLVTAISITVAMLVGCPDHVSAQNATTGALTGVVTDPSGAVVPAVSVELKNNTKGTTQTASTDSSGGYVFSFLRPGPYTLVITKDGFAPVTRNLSVFVGPPSTLNIALSIASAKVEVTVTSERPLLNAEGGDAASTVTLLEVSAIPNPGNDLTYIPQTAPGMVMNTDGGDGNFSNLGMSGLSNVFTLNGMSYNNVGPSVNTSGALNLLLGENQVQEATVVSQPYSGQFGGAAGANVNYISKSGGNRFHGNAAYGWNGRVLNANDWINNATGANRPFDNVNQWAGSVGGPIKQDKLFFFFNTEGIRLLLPFAPFNIQLPSPQFQSATLANISSIFGPGSASDRFYRQIFDLYNATPGASRALPGDFANTLGCQGFVGANGLGTSAPCVMHFVTTRSSPSDESLISGRIDWNLRRSDQAFLLVQYDHGHQASYLDPISPLFDFASEQPWWQGQLTETHAFGSNTLNQFLIAGWYTSAIFRPRDLNQTLAAFPTVLSWDAAGSAFTNLGGQDNFLPSGRNQTHYQVTDDVIHNRGNHTLGFGVNFLAEDWTAFPYSRNATGLLSPLTLDAFYQGGVDPGVLKGTDQNPDFTILRQAFSSLKSSHMHFGVLGVYAQDHWNVRPNLSLTLALRAEHQLNPTCQEHCYARLIAPFDKVSHDPSIPYNQVILPNQKRAFQRLDNVLWMPRFSFAWQPRGVSHNTVLRGGIGLFYDLTSPDLAIALSRNSPILNLFTALDNNLAPDETSSLFKDTAASNAAFLQGFAAGQTLAEVRKALAKIGSASFRPPALVLPGVHTDAAQYQMWSLELEQVLGGSTTATLGYYGHHGIHEFVQNGSANGFGFGTLPPAKCASPPVPPCADPRFSGVTVWNTPGVSNYHGLVLSVAHHWSQGLLRANYTWSHALDEASNDGLGPFLLNSQASPLQPQDPNNLRAAYGPAEYDVRHSLNLSYVWDVPLKAALRGHGPNVFVKGWEVAGTIFARTGFPYSVLDPRMAGALSSFNFFGPIYAVPVGLIGSTGPCGSGAAIPAAPRPCLPPEVLPDSTPNPGALFVQPGCETGFNTGTLPTTTAACGGPSVMFPQGRNHFRGPGYFGTDLAIMKSIKLPKWETATLAFGAQFFNVFNHPNFGLPDNSLPDATFGQISYMAAPPTTLLGSGLGGDASPRMIELKVRLQF